MTRRCFFFVMAIWLASAAPSSPSAAGADPDDFMNQLWNRVAEVLAKKPLQMSGWPGFKITDVIIEGSSPLVAQRSEFASVIQRHGGQVSGR